MSDLEIHNPSELLSSERSLSSEINLTQINYLLYGLGCLVMFTPIVAIVLNYLKRDAVAGTWLESHFDWQIRTFWYGLIGYAIGFVLVWLVVGMPVMLATAVWCIYRVVKGWLRLSEGKPVD